MMSSIQFNDWRVTYRNLREHGGSSGQFECFGYFLVEKDARAEAERLNGLLSRDEVQRGFYEAVRWTSESASTDKELRPLRAPEM